MTEWNVDPVTGDAWRLVEKCQHLNRVSVLGSGCANCENDGETCDDCGAFVGK